MKYINIILSSSISESRQIDILLFSNLIFMFSYNSMMSFMSYIIRRHPTLRLRGETSRVQGLVEGTSESTPKKSIDASVTWMCGARRPFCILWLVAFNANTPLRKNCPLWMLTGDNLRLLRTTSTNHTLVAHARLLQPGRD
jgi:hypothetical protein